MPEENIVLGSKGESLAVGFLRARGYKIISCNYKTRLGEVDIIAQDKDVLCFIEVKTRAGYRFGSGKEAISAIKQRQISKAAVAFLKEKKILNRKARFDVVSVDYSYPQIRFNLIKNAFELDRRFIY